VPDGRLAKHATPEERLAVVARIVDTLGPVLGAEARRARAPARPLVARARPPGRAPGAPARRKGDGAPASPSRLVWPVARRLAHWLPPGVAGFDQAVAWRNNQSAVTRSLHAG
jgi:hypothetical protein